MSSVASLSRHVGVKSVSHLNAVLSLENPMK